MIVLHTQSKKIPQASVLITTFNRPSMLREALQSVFRQNYDGEIEVIVVDDASDIPGTEEVCRSFPNVQYQLLERNLGSAGALNEGIQRARGDCISFLDDDDFWLPNHLASHISALKDEKKCFVVSGLILRDEARKKVEVRPQRPDLSKFVSPMHQLLSVSFIRTPSSVTYLREVFQDIGLFDTANRIGHDTDFYIRSMLDNYQLILTGIPTVVCRLHREGQLTSRISNRKRNEVRLKRTDKYYMMCQKRFPMVPLPQIYARRYAASARTHYDQKLFFEMVTDLILSAWFRFITWLWSLNSKQEICFKRDHDGHKKFRTEGFRFARKEPMTAAKWRERAPTVSVIMPAFDAAHTIREAIQSVLEQTFECFELIVVDDASLDDTAMIIQSISDPRIRLIRCSVRAGAAAGRNRGIQAARGEYIAFMDADDVWYPDKLAMQLKLLEECPEADVAYCWVSHIDESGTALGKGRRIRNEGEVYQALLKDDFISGGSIPLIRKRAITNVGGFDESLEAAQDWDLWLRLAREHRFVCVPSVMVLYRQNHDSISTQFDKMERASLEVIEKNYRALPPEMQGEKRKSLAVRYRYFAQKVFEGQPDLRQWRLGLRYIALALIYDGTLIFQAGGVLARLLRRRNRKRAAPLIKETMQSDPMQMRS